MAYQYENVKLEKGMYGQSGRSFLKVLESLDPSENYMNSEEFAPTQLEGLDKIKDMFGTARNQKQSAKGIY